MRVIVTGAASFIGAACVRNLLAAGHSVVAVVRPGSRSISHLKQMTEGFTEPALTVRELDLRSIETLHEEADAFLHAAWDGAGSENRTKQDVQMENVSLSLGAVRAAKACGCRRFLFTGSQAEYGVRHEVITEEAAASPVSEYAKAKVLFSEKASELCGELGLEYVHARIYSVYGPGDHPWSLVNTCIDTFRAGGRMELSDCTQEWNFLYIDDAADALCRLLTEGKSGFYNIASLDTRPLRAYIEELYELCGRSGSFTYGIRPQNAEGAADLKPNITKILTATSWRPVTEFGTGVLTTIGAKDES